MARPAEELPLIQAILAAGEDDDEARLVYADYMMDRGDPRGELIVVQCRDKTDVLEDRALNLFDDGAARWLGAWHGETSTWRFRRGFLDHLAVPIDTFVTLGAMLFELDPYPDELVHLRSLELRPPREHDLERDELAGALRLLLERLRLTSLALDLGWLGNVGWWGTAAIAPALTPGSVAHLTSLAMPTGFEVGRFIVRLFPPRLETLVLGTLPDAEAEILAGDPRYAKQIRRLVVTTASEPAALALVTPKLTSLDLTCYGVSAPFLDALAQRRPPLVDLSLYRLASSSIVQLGALPTLARLDLRSANIDDGAIDTFLSLPRLASLNIAHTRITPVGIARLYREAGPALRELTLTTPRLSDDLVQRLRARFQLHRWH